MTVCTCPSSYSMLSFTPRCMSVLCCCAASDAGNNHVVALIDVCRGGSCQANTHVRTYVSSLVTLDPLATWLYCKLVHFPAPLETASKVLKTDFPGPWYPSGYVLIDNNVVSFVSRCGNNFALKCSRRVPGGPGPDVVSGTMGGPI